MFVFLVSLVFYPYCDAKLGDRSFFNPDAPITVDIAATAATSEVSTWLVDLETFSAMLSVDSFVPLNENGFWIIGFHSRVKDVPAMINRVGRMDRLPGESEDSAFCSNLPYFFGYTVDSILFLDLVYREQSGSGESVSIFDWRLRYPFLGSEGDLFNKTSLKASRLSIKDLGKCMKTSENFENNTFTYKKVLFHTYVRVKESCVSVLVFDPVHCLEMFEQATMLRWTLSAQIQVMSSVVSRVGITLQSAATVAASVANTRVYEYVDQEGVPMTTSDATLTVLLDAEMAESNDTATQPTDDPLRPPIVGDTTTTAFSFYLLGSFNVEEEDQEWELISVIPSLNFTSLLQHIDNKTAREIGSRLSEEVFTKHLAGQQFPRYLLPAGILPNQEASFHFRVTTEAKERRDAYTTRQSYGTVLCNDSPIGVSPYPLCWFGSGVTTVHTVVEITTQSQSTSYSIDLDAEWEVEMISISGSYGGSVTPLSTSSNRPLYPRESLIAIFSVSPVFVLQKNSLSLVYLTLRSPTSLHLLYSNQGLLEDAPDYVVQEIAGAENAISKSYGSFDCSKDGSCRLELASQVFHASPSGLYRLKIALTLEKSSRKRRSVEEVEKEELIENLGNQTVQVLEFSFAYDDTRDVIRGNGDVTDSTSAVYSSLTIVLLCCFTVQSLFL